MKRNSKYSFKVSLSLESFIDKTICNAMIKDSSSPDERKEIQAIRKQYNFPATHGISYKETELTSSELCDRLLHGHVFCQCMEPQGYFDNWHKWHNGYNKNGSFYSNRKKNDSFKAAYLMCIDVDDEYDYKSIKSYVNKLRFKPTFYYTTYSHQQPGKGLRFRLVYVLDEAITGSYLYYRYCNYKLNCLIEKDTNTTIKDKCNLKAAQYFNGTFVDNPDFKVEYKLTNLIYSLSDFDIYSDKSEDYYNFLKNNCLYAGTEHKDDIEEEIFRIKPNQKIEKEENEKDIFSDSFVIKEIIHDIKIDDIFIYDMKHLTFIEFRNKYRYPIIYRKVSEQWYDLIIDDINYKWQNVPNNYFELFYPYVKIKNGNKRRKTLFIRMCLRRLIKPLITPTEILFNAYMDLHQFIDNTDKSDYISIDDLIKTIYHTMSLTIEDIKDRFKNEIEYLFNNKPKFEYGVLFAPGINYKNGLHYWLINRFDELYDSNKSFKDNFEYINQVFKSENRKPIGERVLRQYKHDLKPNKRLTGKELKSLINFSKGIKWNLNQLRNIGYKVNEKEVTDLINQRKKQREQRKQEK